jgi:hypothetical protein
MARLDYLLSLTPRESWRILRHRLPGLRSGPSWRPNELIYSSKHGRGIRFAELLLRQEAVLHRAIGWAPLDFDGKRVVEIGCGPLGGYGPLAIFCGATAFESAEPEWDPQLFLSPEVVEKYHFIFYADLVALYGERMNFAEFRKRLRERMNVQRCGFEKFTSGGKADIVISQSCLEHVFPIEGTIDKLAEIQTQASRFLHLVDFGNHYPTGNPLEGLYEQPRDDYIARRGKAMNLLRAPDIDALFKSRNIPARLVPSRNVKETYRGTIHPWWRERYDDAALFTQLALVAGPA